MVSLPVGELPVRELPVGELSVRELPVGELPVRELSVGELPVGELNRSNCVSLELFYRKKTSVLMVLKLKNVYLYFKFFYLFV